MSIYDALREEREIRAANRVAAWLTCPHPVTEPATGLCRSCGERFAEFRLEGARRDEVRFNQPLIFRASALSVGWDEGRQP